MAHVFRRFTPWLLDLLPALVVTQHILEEVGGRAKLFTSWQPGSKEDRARIWVYNVSLRVIPTVTRFPSTRPLAEVLPPPNSATGWQPSFYAEPFGEPLGSKLYQH